MKNLVALLSAILSLSSLAEVKITSISKVIPEESLVVKERMTSCRKDWFWSDDKCESVWGFDEFSFLPEVALGAKGEFASVTILNDTKFAIDCAVLIKGLGHNGNEFFYKNHLNIKIGKTAEFKLTQNKPEKNLMEAKAKAVCTTLDYLNK
jgi:hypothetical protein